MSDLEHTAKSAGEPAGEPAGNDTEKRVGWAELFFDLVFVFAVTEVSSLVGGDHPWSGLLRALVVFVSVYWMWVGTAIQTNVRDISKPSLRVAIFAVALAAVFMALALPEAYTRLGMLYAGGVLGGPLRARVRPAAAAVRHALATAKVQLGIARLELASSRVLLMGHRYPVSPDPMHLAIHSTSLGMRRLNDVS